jgi:hypothetical protein
MLAYSPQDDDALQLSGHGHPERLNNLVDWSCEDIQQDVLKESSGLLAGMDELKSAGRDAQLLEITRSFIRASIALNAQYPWLELRFRPKMMDVQFSLDHHLVTWHRGLRLKEDDQDDGPDAEEAGIANRQIDLVVEPTVLRHGEKNGTGYDQTRVLIKGVVWMVKGGDLEGKTSVGSALTSIPGHAVAGLPFAMPTRTWRPVDGEEHRAPVKTARSFETSGITEAQQIVSRPPAPKRATDIGPTIKQELNAETVNAEAHNRKRKSEGSRSVNKKQRTRSSVTYMGGLTRQSLQSMDQPNDSNTSQPNRSNSGPGEDSASKEGNASREEKRQNPFPAVVTPPLNGIKHEDIRYAESSVCRTMLTQASLSPPWTGI